MQISERVERSVREAFSAAIARDPDRIRRALHGLNDADSWAAVALALNICGVVTREVCPNGSDEEYDLLARQIFELEDDWVTLDEKQLARFVKATASVDASFDGMDEADVTMFAIVCGSHLLRAFRGDDQLWYEFLDQILDTLLTTPGPES